MADERASTAWRALPVALLIIAGSLGANHGDPHFYPAALTSAVAALAVVGAVWAPGPALLIGGVSLGAYLGLGYGNGPIFLTLPLTAFLAGRARPLSALRVPLGAALVVAAAGMVLRVTNGHASAVVTTWQGVGVLALTLATTAFGGWLHDRRAMRQEQSRRAATEEQLRMAQDLHDGVGHGLAVIAMNAGASLHLLDKPDVDREALRRSLEAIRQTSRDSLEALRVELSAIRAPATRRPVNGLPELDALLDRIRAGGLAVERSGEPGELPDDVGQAVYAVVQESLTNVLRHADAGMAVVTLRRTTDRLQITIRDDGKGAAGVTTGMGISGMRERVTRLDGSFETSSRADGFTVDASIPVRG